MLVPTVNPATLAYAAGPRARSPSTGARLIGRRAGGETVIGRSAVRARSYISATPKQIVVPLPDDAADAAASTSSSELRSRRSGRARRRRADVAIDIGGTVARRSRRRSRRRCPRADGRRHRLRESDPRRAIPTDPRCSSALGSTLWQDALLHRARGSRRHDHHRPPAAARHSPRISGSTARPAGRARTRRCSPASLASPPPLSATAPRLRVTVGAQPPRHDPSPRQRRSSALADDLQAKINAASARRVRRTRCVAISGSSCCSSPALRVLSHSTPARRRHDGRRAPTARELRGSRPGQRRREQRQRCGGAAAMSASNAKSPTGAEQNAAAAAAAADSGSACASRADAPTARRAGRRLVARRRPPRRSGSSRGRRRRALARASPRPTEVAAHREELGADWPARVAQCRRAGGVERVRMRSAASGGGAVARRRVCTRLRGTARRSRARSATLHLALSLFADEATERLLAADCLMPSRTLRALRLLDVGERRRRAAAASARLTRRRAGGRLSSRHQPH